MAQRNQAAELEDSGNAAIASAAEDVLRAAFRERLAPHAQLEAHLGAALSYVLDHAGSMVRPRIIYRMAKAHGIEEQAAIDLAIALEYFHTSSLIFDDLPCMDNASMRRGAPCVHLPYGEAGAVLAALALINRAYALVWRAAGGCAEPVRRDALAYLERHLGVNGLLNGQSLDLNYASLPHTLESTERIARGKTVSLIALTLVLPALTGGAEPRTLQQLERISLCWGLAYQIADDLKDVLDSPAATGKTTARDESLDRPNTALAIGVQAARERLERLLRLGDRALNALLTAQPSLQFLREFRSSLEDELERVVRATTMNPIGARP